DRLGSLSGSVLEQLNQQGYLSAIYMAVASLSQFRELIDRVNQTQC
ncbi:MAG: SapC family protein, partial [Xanthomonadales bacterium]|nr:SapC family protein [Xanthomonadales bacterium]